MTVGRQALPLSPWERLATLEAIAVDLDKKLDRVVELLDGPNGLVVRLDRVEQQGKRAQWFNRALAAGVIGSALAWLWPMLAERL